MKNVLNILLLEDDSHDADLIAHEFDKRGVTCRLNRVVTQEAFLRSLKDDRPDVILSDHGLPSFSGFEALALARKECPDAPFIFVTGSRAEEREIEMFEQGGIDYVLKSQMSRLVPVLWRVMRKEAERVKHRQHEQELRENEERFRVLIDTLKDHAICMLDEEGRIITWNSGAELITGYHAQEILGRHFSCFYEAAAIACDLPSRVLACARAKRRFEAEGVLIRRGGTQFRAAIVITAIFDAKDELVGFALVVRDITAHKRKETERERLIKELQAALNRIRTMSGMLPVCNSCKKIRDYQGRWHPLEAYLKEHLNATLAYESCQECTPHIQ